MLTTIRQQQWEEGGKGRRKKLIFKLKISYINTPLRWSSLSLLHIEGNFLARFFFIFYMCVYIFFFYFTLLDTRGFLDFSSGWLYIFTPQTNAPPIWKERERERMCYVWEKDIVLSESCAKKTQSVRLDRIRKQQWLFSCEKANRKENKCPGAEIREGKGRVCCCCCCSIFTLYPVLY